MPTIDEINTWQGATVTDREGEKIGSIDEVYVDRDSGEPEWLAVKTGLFGTKLSFVPVAEATRTGEAVRVPYEKAQVKDAPQVDADGELSEAEKTDLGLRRHQRPQRGPADGARAARGHRRGPQGADRGGPAGCPALIAGHGDAGKGRRNQTRVLPESQPHASASSSTMRSPQPPDAPDAAAITTSPWPSSATSTVRW
jgi:sporulation protein YlmC with PRC-barrel domain